MKLNVFFGFLSAVALLSGGGYYVYDGETPFEDLPEDWVCPLCGVDKSHFVYE